MVGLKEGVEIFLVGGGIIIYYLLPTIIPNPTFLKYFGIILSIITTIHIFSEKRQNFLGHIKNIQRTLLE
jgi:hypothetical protein